MRKSKRKHEDQTLLALVQGKTVEEAASASGVSARTVHRRLQQPEFCRRLSDARNAYVLQTVGRLSESATKAVDTLEDLLEAKMEPVRLGAARAILEIGLRMRREFVLEHRLKALEDAQRPDGVAEESLSGHTVERLWQPSGASEPEQSGAGRLDTARSGRPKPVSAHWSRTSASGSMLDAAPA